MKVKTTKSNLIIKSATGLGVTASTLAIFSFFAPSIINNTSAESTSTDVYIDVAQTIAISTSVNGVSANSVAVSLDPSDAGAFAKTASPVDVLVSTNNATGYTLTISSSDDTNTMNHANTAITDTIAPLSVNTGVTTDDFALAANTQYNNQWGFSYNSSSFYPVPTNANPMTIATTSAPSTDSTTAIDFGTRVSTTLPAGSYSDTITLSATANFSSGDATSKTIYDITTMQEMTSNICSATTTPLATATEITTAYSTDTSKVPQATLKDSRDGKRYIIRKLADGNCWMSQNLDLDLTTTMTLTSDDTDIQTAHDGTARTSWTPGVVTETESNATVWGDGNNEASINIVRSYDPGNLYCTGAESGANQTCSTTRTNDNTEHVGNYYNWYTATAGTGTYADTSTASTDEETGAVISDPEANDSICPKGWTLPTNSTTLTLANGNLYSYKNLVNTTYSAGNNAAGAVIVRSAPLSFPFSGFYSASSGAPASQGTLGRFWSSSAYSATNSRYLSINRSNVNPSTFYNKRSGYSVRCVAL